MKINNLKNILIRKKNTKKTLTKFNKKTFGKFKKTIVNLQHENNNKNNYIFHSTYHTFLDDNTNISFYTIYK